MGKKKDKIVYAGNVPLRDRGILAKPMSPKETELDRQVDAGKKYLEENPQVEDTSIHLYGSYKAWVNSRMPGTAEAEKAMLYKAVSSLRLVIEQQRGKPMTAKIEQRFFPCPFPENKVTALNPKFHARLQALDEDDRVVTIDDSKVHHRLVVSMEYDLSRPVREQVLEFSEESEILVAQYCVYRDSKVDDDLEAQG